MVRLAIFVLTVWAVAASIAAVVAFVRLAQPPKKQQVENESEDETALVDAIRKGIIREEVDHKTGNESYAKLFPLERFGWEVRDASIAPISIQREKTPDAAYKKWQNAKRITRAMKDAEAAP